MGLFIKKKNIIFCTTEYTSSKEFGGLAIFLHKFLKVLKKDFTIHLVVSSDNNKFQNLDGINIYNVKTNNLFYKILNKYFVTFFFILQSRLINKKVNELIDKLKFVEFVHFSNYQCIGLLYNNKFPTVTRLSSLETLWNSYSFFSLTKLLEKYTLSKTSIILSPSNFLIDELKKKYKLKAYFLPPLIEKIKNFKNKTKKKIIITFGSISPGKGSLSIEKTIDEILSINKDIYYYWIGNVDKRFYSSNFFFENKLKEKTKFRNRIKIINKLSRKKLFNFINKSKIIILPSLRDNSPNACIEALSMKKIIIARKNSGYNDLIKNNYNGFLFNKKNDFEIPILVSKILSLSKRRKNILKNNINNSNNKFSPKKVVSKYKNYIKNIT